MWFQNRRTKYKRDKSREQEERQNSAESLATCNLLRMLQPPTPEVRNPSCLPPRILPEQPKPEVPHSPRVFQPRAPEMITPRMLQHHKPEVLSKDATQNMKKESTNDAGGTEAGIHSKMDHVIHHSGQEDVDTRVMTHNSPARAFPPILVDAAAPANHLPPPGTLTGTAFPGGSTCIRPHPSFMAALPVHYPPSLPGFFSS